MSKKSIDPEMLPALQGVIPSIIGTCSAMGIPNVTYISQVFYVDESRVAISYQFFNKTIHNIRENPFLCVYVTCPVNYVLYKCMLRYIESQASGEIFDEMSVQLEAIASAHRQPGLLKLRAADIYEVLSIEKIA
jgi:hypothetical protein